MLQSTSNEQDRNINRETEVQQAKNGFDRNRTARDRHQRQKKERETGTRETATKRVRATAT